ncbi:ATP-binding cassette domain-containing protein [Aquamicrobium soli]|uniref:ATP-binding cassette domain-containing protein n=1 Tax=Aquamicrobium soli TaxID=1811518 RepID=A0ABV7KAQ8_9HYPH
MLDNVYAAIESQPDSVLADIAREALDKYPIQLIQGKQQRIGVARAFVTRPNLVVPDEPMPDIRFHGEIVRLMKRLQQETGCAYLFISHDLISSIRSAIRLA